MAGRSGATLRRKPQLWLGEMGAPALLFENRINALRYIEHPPAGISPHDVKIRQALIDSGLAAELHGINISTPREQSNAWSKFVIPHINEIEHGVLLGDPVAVAKAKALADLGAITDSRLTSLVRSRGPAMVGIPDSNAGANLTKVILMVFVLVVLLAALAGLLGLR